MTRHYGYATVTGTLDRRGNARRGHGGALQLANGERVIRLERCVLHKDEPILYCLDYIPRSIIPNRLYDIEWGGSLLDLLEQYRHRPRMSLATVTAVMLPEDVVGAQTNLRDFGPALLIRETCFNAAACRSFIPSTTTGGSHFFLQPRAK